MPGEDITIKSGMQQDRVPARSNNPATTIGGRYTVGDTRTKPTGHIEIVGDEIEKWQAGFDIIDSAPKDGKLSLDEICDYRDKQVKVARYAFWTNPMNWFNPQKQVDFNLKLRATEIETEQYRTN